MADSPTPHVSLTWEAQAQNQILLLEAIRLLTAEVRALRRASSAEADERPEPIGIDVFGQPIFPQEATLEEVLSPCAQTGHEYLQPLSRQSRP